MWKLLAAAALIVCSLVLLRESIPAMESLFPTDNEGAREAATGSRTIRLLEQFEMTRQDERGVSHAIAGDEAVVRPRRFLVFNMKSVNEMHVTNGKVDLYLHKNTGVEADLLSLDPSFFASDADDSGVASLPKQFGVVTRLVVEDLVARIYEDGQLKVTAVANVGYQRFRENKPELLGTTLSNPDKTRRIQTRKAIWDKQEKVFHIPGNYRLYTRYGMVQANGAKVDLDLEVRPFVEF